MRILICLILIGLMGFINAQGITNTLGGNTANDKFIVENSDSEAGIVVTGDGKVGIGIDSPSFKLHVVGNDLTNTYTGIKSQAENFSGDFGIGIESNMNGLIGFDAVGQIYGVRGIVVGGENNYGLYGEATDAILNSIGVYGTANGYFNGYGVYGTAWDKYAGGTGGYFEVGGWWGTAVQGHATYSGDIDGINTGGYFVSEGIKGVGIVGHASHLSGVNYGIRGKTNSPDGWAGYFEGRGYFSENVGIGTETPGTKLSIVGLSEYSGNTAAITAGLTVGDLYRTGDLLKIVH